ncbi:MAG: ComEC/Rec2 family competence protein [Bdellovibrionales bacterium]|nr:ComEC/Rec2 family competence protein [Bdellovibrionales bacterium]
MNEFFVGDEVEFCAKFSFVEHQKWALDWKDYYRSRDLSFFASAIYKEKLVQRSFLSPLRKKLFDFQNDFFSYLQSTFSENHVWNLKAQVFGWPFPKELKNPYQNLGIFHLLVVSGFHVGLVYVLGGLISKLFFFLFFIKRKNPIIDPFVVGGASAFLLLYKMISFSSLPSQRAYTSMGLFLFIRLFLVKVRSLEIIYAVALVFMFWNPSHIYDLSFQLSFVSTWSILFFLDQRPFQELSMGPMNTVGLKITSWLYPYFCINLSAYMGSLPIIVYWFGTFFPFAFFGNFLLSPFIGLIGISISFLSLFLYVFGLGSISLWTFSVYANLHDLVKKIDLFLSQYVELEIPMPNFSGLSYLFYMLFSFCVLGFLPTAKNKPNMRAKTLFVLALFLIFSFSMLKDSENFFFY